MMMMMMMMMIMIIDPDNSSLFSVETAVQQGGRSVEEPRLKLDEFPGGQEHPQFPRCFCSKGRVCLVENLQKLQLKLLVSRL